MHMRLVSPVKYSLQLLQCDYFCVMSPRDPTRRHKVMGPYGPDMCRRKFVLTLEVKYIQYEYIYIYM